MSRNTNRPRLGDPLNCRPKQNQQVQHAQSRLLRLDEPGTMEKGHEKDDENADTVKRSIFRRNDSGLGQPDFEPDLEAKKNIRPVSSEDVETIRQDQDDIRRQFEEKLLEFEKAGIKIPASVYRVILWAMVFVGAVLGLFLVNQAVRFVAQAAYLSFPWNIMAGSVYLLFLGIILLVMVRVLSRFLAFRRMARVDLKALNILAERKRFQHLALKKKDEARDLLLGYLDDFKIRENDPAVPGLEKSQAQKLKAIRQALIEKKGYTDSSRWLREFDESFVHILDKAARKRIRAYTKTVAVGTAASPIKFIDQMIVLYSSLKLIGELLQIYNLRPAFGQSATILSRAVIQAYLSGLISEQSDAGVESFSEYYENIFGEISFATGISAVTDATRFVLPKVSEGALNGFLIWRLGRQSMRMVRPL